MLEERVSIKVGIINLDHQKIWIISQNVSIKIKSTSTIKQHE